MNGGVLTAENGRIEIGGVSKPGVVDVNTNLQGFSLGYSGIQGFADITLGNQSLANVSGASAGSIQVQGSQVSLKDGSVILVQNRGIQSAGDINVRADSLTITGGIPNRNIRSNLLNETLAGKGGNITISTQNLNILDGGAIGIRTFGAGASGNVNITSTKEVNLHGFSTINPELFSGIGSVSFGGGRSGDVTINTPHLSLSDGGIITVTTFGTGNAGSITINADKTEVVGWAPNSFGSSGIASSSYGIGNAGSVVVNGRLVSIRDGGTVNTLSLNRGSAGNVIINATEAVEILGNAPQIGVRSSINSRLGNPSNPSGGLTNPPPGNAGNVNINTSNLTIADGASVNVLNLGTGRNGTIIINSDSIILQQGTISAASTLSQQASTDNKLNIDIQSQNIQMRDNSIISATAGSTSKGGNIGIKADTIVQLENSDITANASQGKGGNIQISTQALFQSPDSRITATGSVDGNIEITTSGIKQDNALLEQASNFVSTEKVVATTCLASRNASQGKFVMTGNGGLAEIPNTSSEIPYSVVQLRPVLVSNKVQQIQKTTLLTQPWKIGDNILEATALITTADGKLLLAATYASSGEYNAECRYSSYSKHNNLISISTANIKQLHVEGITSKLDELINTTHSTIKLLYERRTALIEAAVSGRLQAIM